MLLDLQIVGQANTFTLAGYETTANTLSYCVYNIASHPEVQGRLLAEIDAYGRHRKVACQDMNQVRAGAHTATCMEWNGPLLALFTYVQIFSLSASQIAGGNQLQLKTPSQGQ